ncbi:glutamate carboxypeptidase [Methylobacterium brachythecii]|uniref:Glutamate carboxypeptidase n=1 Tax=Methylobacterium brachythecii TaxID=1176177 RepID=A0A7W6AK04_9HYPH|nr:glutamate carboxypeptidase [Methylobacterium brachythecii]MBB3902266.1 glutamate carboxypeptidase [Methylobacterium brachythecii]GLS42113.1 glutamate carboxypeptidase [Methylobacterium brachythecii]
MPLPRNRLSRLAVATLAASVALALPAQAEPNATVLKQAETYKQPVLTLLEKLVSIDSGTADAKGVDAVAEVVKAELSALGAKVETVPSSVPDKGANVVATLSGSGNARILLVAHMDTVFPAGEVAKRPFKIEGGRATGPGVMDDKGGIVLALYALHALRDLGYTNYRTITLLLNSNEETGSAGSHELISAQARQHDVVFNLEPGRPTDGLVIARKGAAQLQVDVKGRGAHAGVAPDSGRNAATELAHQVLAIGSLGDRAKETTVNVTTLKAGTVVNVIPDAATAQGDMRAYVSEEFDRVERDLSGLAKTTHVPDTSVTTKLTRTFPPMPRNAGTDGLAAKAQAIYAEIGRKLTLESSGGAADSSFTAAAGTPTIDGLGIVGGGIHSKDEYAEVESIVPRLYLLTRLIMETGGAN